jgi:hypothetical protein
MQFLHSAKLDAALAAEPIQLRSAIGLVPPWIMAAAQEAVIPIKRIAQSFNLVRNPLGFTQLLMVLTGKVTPGATGREVNLDLVLSGRSRGHGGEGKSGDDDELHFC